MDSLKRDIIVPKLEAILTIVESSVPRDLVQEHLIEVGSLAFTLSGYCTLWAPWGFEYGRRMFNNAIAGCHHRPYTALSLIHNDALAMLRIIDGIG